MVTKRLPSGPVNSQVLLGLLSTTDYLVNPRETFLSGWRETPRLPGSFPLTAVDGSYHKTFIRYAVEEFVNEIRQSVQKLILCSGHKSMQSSGLVIAENVTLDYFSPDKFGTMESSAVNADGLLGDEIVCLAHRSSPPSKYSTPATILFLTVSVEVTPAQTPGQPDKETVKLRANTLNYELFNHKVHEPLTIYRITSLTPFDRIMNAIDAEEVSSFLPRILAPRQFAPVLSESKIHLGTLTSNLMDGLNDSQIKAIHRILRQSEPSAHIVQGPPGTGKTSTLAVLMLTLLERQEVIVYTATTNVAAKGGLRKLLAITEGKDHSALFHHSDLVLLGNPDKLQLSLDPVSSSFYLRFRVERISDDLKVYMGDSVRMLEVLAYSPESDAERNSIHNSWTQYIKNLMEVTDELQESSQAFGITWEKCLPAAAKIPTIMPSSKGEKIPEDLQLYVSKVDIQEKLETTFGMILSASRKLVAAVQVVGPIFSKSSALFTKVMSDHTTERSPAIIDFKDALDEVKQVLATRVNAVRKLLCPDSKLNWNEIIMKAVKISFSTLSTAGSRPIQELLSRKPMVIVDEATQAPESLTLIVLKSGIRGLVMVGDQKQLSATVMSRDCIDKGYERSLFERLIMNGYPSIMLLVQYRMHPSISRWPSAQFYDGKLQNGANVSAPHPLRNIISPLQIVDLPMSKESQDKRSFSRCNEMEADMVVAKVEELIKQVNALPKQTDKPTSVSIGIVTFYKAQRFLIADLLAASTAGLVEVGDELHFKDGLVTVSVNTVDGFQGQERDIILLSTVLAETNGRPSNFIGQPKRLNVALTRAKHALHIFTNIRCVRKVQLWSDLFYENEDHVVVKEVEYDTPSSAALSADELVGWFTRRMRL